MSLQLMKDEKILWKSYPGKKYRTFLFITQFGLALLISIFFGVVAKELGMGAVFTSKVTTIISIGIVLVGLIYAGYNQLMFLFIQYFITTDRIIIKRGWLNRKLSSTKHENIHDTKVEQSFTERLISTGHVYIFTANDTNVSLDSSFLNTVPCFKSIDDPFMVHQLLEQAVEENSKQ